MTDEPEQISADRHLSPSEADTATTSDHLQREEFSAFYRANIANLVGILIMQGARGADAADVAQETMIKLWKSWYTVDSPKAWARRVASRELIRRLVDADEELIDPAERSALIRTTSDLDDWVQNNEYQRGLAALPPRQRQILVWTMEGYRSTEIADQFKIKASTVRSLRRKARRAMALYLAAGEQR
ncbi:sigma-70 family RNA polymerase sigma factor [Nocardia asteroides]|uniref:sigma-70 family RNA polymerase sigma factor n=1 Tax=Nocardia asteroides TaxID=1824 RepID=UPI0037A4DB06